MNLVESNPNKSKRAMGKFSVQSLVTSMICVLLVTFAGHSMVKARKIDARADMVVIVNHFYPVSSTRLFAYEQEALMDGLAKLPTFFQMSNQKTR